MKGQWPASSYQEGSGRRGSNNVCLFLVLYVLLALYLYTVSVLFLYLFGRVNWLWSRPPMYPALSPFMRSHPTQTSLPKQTENAYYIHVRPCIIHLPSSRFFPCESIRSNNPSHHIPFDLSQTQPIQTHPVHTPLPPYNPKFEIPLLACRRPTPNIPFLGAEHVSETFA